MVKLYDKPASHLERQARKRLADWQQQELISYPKDRVRFLRHRRIGGSHHAASRHDGLMAINGEKWRAREAVIALLRHQS